MNEAYRRLCTSLPERESAARGAFATDARALREWVDALPMANFSVAVQRMLDALQALSGQRVDGLQRLAALEALRGPALLLVAATDKQIVGACFPLPTQKAELGEIAARFQQTLALGYRRALADICGPRGAVPFLRGKQVTLAAVRALQHEGEHLARSYLVYRTPPAGAWQALHDVHRFIVSLRLDDREVDESAGAESVSARSVYVRALLTALSNPYRHSQREQVEMAAFMHVLAPHARLREGNGDAHDILVDTHADAGPGYLPEEREYGMRGVLALHVNPLLAFVEDQLARAPRGAPTVQFRMRGGAALNMGVDLVQRFVAGLSARAERGHARLGGGYTLDTVLGLHDLHFVLAGGEDFESFMRRVRGEAISLSETDRAATWRIGASDPARVSRLPARVLDQGLGGYRLLWERGDGAVNARVRVAELVGLALPDPDADARPDWMIGVIRWIRIDDEGRVDAGVELLARRALPVGVRALDADGAQSRAPTRGVLLAALDVDGDIDYNALLAPTEIDRMVGALELTVPADLNGPPRPAHTEKAADLRLRETTGIYQHFALAPQHAPAAVAEQESITGT